MSTESQPTPQPLNIDIVRKIFDAAISMPPGSKIPLTFGSESQRESFRVRFYNEKKRYSEVVGEVESDTIICAKHSAGSRYMLLIEKVSPMSTPYIVSPDGSVIEIDLTTPLSSSPSSSTLPPSISTILAHVPIPTPAPETLNLGSGSETPEQRRLRLMAQDACATQDPDEPPE